MGFEPRAAFLLILPPAGLPASTRASLPFHFHPVAKVNILKGHYVVCVHPLLTPCQCLIMVMILSRLLTKATW